MRDRANSALGDAASARDAARGDAKKAREADGAEARGASESVSRAERALKGAQLELDRVEKWAWAGEYALEVAKEGLKDCTEEAWRLPEFLLLSLTPPRMWLRHVRFCLASVGSTASGLATLLG